MLTDFEYVAMSRADARRRRRARIESARQQIKRRKRGLRTVREKRRAQ